MAIDPIALTRQLVDIESTTYHEGLAGTFLREYLIGQKYAVECMAVEQPDHGTPGCGQDDRFNVYAALHGVTPDVVLSTHMDTVPPYFSCTEDDEFSTAAAPAMPRASSPRRSPPPTASARPA